MLFGNVMEYMCLPNEAAVETVLQVFTWLLAHYTVIAVFVTCTSRGNTRAVTNLGACTAHSYWAHLSSTPVVGTVGQLLTWVLVRCTVTGRTCQVHQSWEH